MENKLTTIPEIKSLTDIVRHSRELPTIRNANQDEVNKAILELLIEVFSFYNESLNDVQLKLTLPTVKEALQGLTIPDIHIFKKHCLQGEYPLRFRLIPNVLIEWIKQYKFDRGEAFASMSYLSHVETKKETEYSEKTVELLKGLEKKVSEKLGEKYIISSIAPKDKYAIQAKALQKWIEKEFEVKWEEQGKQMTNEEYSKQFINHKGYFVLKFEYVKARYEEIYKTFITQYKKLLKSCEQCPSQSEYIYTEIDMLIK